MNWASSSTHFASVYLPKCIKSKRKSPATTLRLEPLSLPPATEDFSYLNQHVRFVLREETHPVSDWFSSDEFLNASDEDKRAAADALQEMARLLEAETARLRALRG